MANNRRSKVKVIPLAVGQDPSLWRYESVQEALGANIEILSEMIRAAKSHNWSSPKIAEYSIDDDSDSVAAAR